MPHRSKSPYKVKPTLPLPLDKCPLCDTPLVLKHIKPSHSLIVEKAHCPQCHVPARDRSFTVH